MHNPAYLMLSRHNIYYFRYPLPKPPQGKLEYNSLYIINDKGELVDRYDKRFCAGDAKETSGDLAHYIYICVIFLFGTELTKVILEARNKTARTGKLAVKK